ncbi:MAG: NfeD family protein [Bacilli bacterium]|jgi:membrane protein implicated in regulation of membrane protease activity
MTWLEITMIVFWALIIVITIIVEINTFDLVSLWFTVGAIVAIILAALKIEPLVQIGVFVGISLVLIIALKPLTKNIRSGKSIVKTNADRVVGMVGVVTKNITPGDVGQVKVDGELWHAINQDGKTILEGKNVSIKAISGIKLIVGPIEEETKKL